MFCSDLKRPKPVPVWPGLLVADLVVQLRDPTGTLGLLFDDECEPFALPEAAGLDTKVVDAFLKTE
jgi:hypothetical protein